MEDKIGTVLEAKSGNRVRGWIEIGLSVVSLVLLVLVAGQYLGWWPLHVGGFGVEGSTATPVTMYAVSPLPTPVAGEWYDVCPPECPEVTPMPTLTPRPSPTCRPTRVSCATATPYPTGTPWPAQPGEG